MKNPTLLLIVVAIGCGADDASTDDTVQGDAGDAAEATPHPSSGGAGGGGATGGSAGSAVGSGGNSAMGGAAGSGGKAGTGGAGGAGGSAGTGGKGGAGGTGGASGSAGTAGAGGTTKSYTTNFDGTENPLSEGGAWSHTGLDWKTAQKSGGFAYGTQTGTGGYDDSYAVLSGFAPDHTGSAAIHLVNNIDRSCTHEVEILLRWSDSAHSAKGYECNVSFDGGYVQIVRWNGPLGDFTYLGAGAAPGLKDGDTVKATVVGNVITVYVNDVQRAQATDATHKTGNPGVGFFRRNCGANSDYGFTSFTATSQ